MFKHSCNNLVLICMDFRFQQAIHDWLKNNGYEGNYDLISMAGAEQAITDEKVRPIFLKYLDISVKLHQVKKVIIIAHQDCGAYGGSKAFASIAEEFDKHKNELNLAENIIKGGFPDLFVGKKWLTFDEQNDIQINNVDN